RGDGPRLGNLPPGTHPGRPPPEPGGPHEGQDRDHPSRLTGPADKPVRRLRTRPEGPKGGLGAQPPGSGREGAAGAKHPLRPHPRSTGHTPHATVTTRHTTTVTAYRC